MKKLLVVFLFALGMAMGTAQKQGTKLQNQEIKKEKHHATPKLKKDGTPDRRYKANQKLKKDGTPDKRYKENKVK